jgi:hypothetical protein
MMHLKIANYLKRPTMCTENDGYHIDFLPTGKGSATCLRYESPEHPRLMVYDGGDYETGKKLVRHIREHYGTNVVDDLVYSHPDADHGAGLFVILQELEVRNLWMHRPWAHSAPSDRYFGSGKIADVSLAAHFKEKMAAMYALEQLALERGVRLSEPFQGARIGPFTVLSPHYDWYMHTLIPAFETHRPVRRPVRPLVERLLRQSGVQIDDLDDEQADNPPMQQMSGSTGLEARWENGETSAENESSVVLFGLIGGRGVLLTGSAGVKALSAAAGYAESKRVMAPICPAYAPARKIPEMRMKVLAHAPKSWILLADGDDHYLDVSCNLSGCKFSLLIKLTKEEWFDYQIKGTPSIQDIAQKVQRSPTTYYGQNQSIQTQKYACSAIMELNGRKRVKSPPIPI